MTLNLFEQFIISAVVGNRGQDKPAHMRLAVNVLDKIDLPIGEIEKLNRVSPHILASRDEDKEVSFTSEESKFIVRTLRFMPKGNEWVGEQLTRLLPLWDRMYPEWVDLKEDE